MRMFHIAEGTITMYDRARPITPIGGKGGTSIITPIRIPTAAVVLLKIPLRSMTVHYL